METAASPRGEACADCGFVWDDLDVPEIRQRLATTSVRWADIFASSDLRLKQRPSDDVWSPIEYRSHVRDVLFNLRDRVVLGLAEDNPSPKSMHATLRVDRGMYSAIQPAELATDLTVAARLFVEILSVITATDARRPIFYGWPRPATRTVRWVAAQALHEAEHHLHDVEQALTSSEQAPA